MNGSDIIKYCQHLGAEARANGRKHMTKDDRDDIATRGGYGSWLKIPEGQRNDACKAFYDGWESEGGW